MKQLVLVLSTFLSLGTTWALEGFTFNSNPPQFLEKPQSLAVAPGETATFNCVGTNVYFYHWYFKGQLVGRKPALVIRNVQHSDAGLYRIKISYDDSEWARLEVQDRVRVQRAPQDLTVYEHASPIFTVGATGTALRYQWQFQGNDIPGATNAMLRLTNVLSSAEGLYSVIVSNKVSSTNVSASLVVNQSPFDLNTNGFTDILLHDSETGQWRVALMNRSTVSQCAPVGETLGNYRFVGMSDFDGDGQKDIVLEAPGSTDLTILPLSGYATGVPYQYPVPSPAVLYGPTVPPPAPGPGDPGGVIIIGLGHYSSVRSITRSVYAVGDFDGDASDDFLVRDGGSVYVWSVNGTNFNNSSLTAIVSADDISQWQIVGTGDFNHDRKTDILWRSVADGKLHAWLMDGVQYVSTVDVMPMRPPGLNWNVAAIADFNGDGNSDLLLQGSDGEVMIRFLDGNHVMATKVLTDPRLVNTRWQIVGPR